MAGKSNSGAEPTIRSFPFPAFPGMQNRQLPSGMNWLAQQYAQGALTSLSLFESWASNYRTASDAWRASLRQQQDTFLESMKAQLNLLSAETPAEPGRAGKAELSPPRSEKSTSSKARETA